MKISAVTPQGEIKLGTVPKGGTSRQVLSKRSDTDLDYDWTNNDLTIKSSIALSTSSNTVLELRINEPNLNNKIMLVTLKMDSTPTGNSSLEYRMIIVNGILTKVMKVGMVFPSVYSTNFYYSYPSSSQFVIDIIGLLSTNANNYLITAEAKLYTANNAQMAFTVANSITIVTSGGTSGTNFGNPNTDYNFVQRDTSPGPNGKITRLLTSNATGYPIWSNLPSNRTPDFTNVIGSNCRYSFYEIDLTQVSYQNPLFVSFDYHYLMPTSTYVSGSIKFVIAKASNGTIFYSNGEDVRFGGLFEQLWSVRWNANTLFICFQTVSQIDYLTISNFSSNLAFTANLSLMNSSSGYSAQAIALEFKKDNSNAGYLSSSIPSDSYLSAHSTVVDFLSNRILRLSTVVQTLSNIIPVGETIFRIAPVYSTPVPSWYSLPSPSSITAAQILYLGSGNNESTIIGTPIFTSPTSNYPVFNWFNNTNFLDFRVINSTITNNIVANTFIKFVIDFAISPTQTVTQNIS